VCGEGLHRVGVSETFGFPLFSHSHPLEDLGVFRLELLDRYNA
jgi:hypothetical protein